MVILEFFIWSSFMISLLLSSYHFSKKQIKHQSERSQKYYHYYQNKVHKINPISGNATFFSMLIMLTILALLLTIIQTQLKHHNDHLSAQKGILCLKNFNQMQMNYLTQVNEVNKYIRLINIGSIGSKVFSLILPGLSIVNLSTKKALSVLKLYQQKLTLIYIKEQAQFLKEPCLVLRDNISFYYQMNGLKLKRSKLGTTILRKERWSQKVLTRKIIIITKVNLKNAYQKPTYLSAIKLIGKKGLAY